MLNTEMWTLVSIITMQLVYGKVDHTNRIVHFDNGDYSTSSTTRTINGYKKYFVDYLGYDET